MFIIDIQSKDPIYEQIKKQINKFIQLEVLKPDDRLPSVRSLALDLGVNPNTVSKAYQELEAEGIVYTLNKKGVFVANSIAKDLTIKSYLENFKQVVYECKQFKIERIDLINTIDEVYKGGNIND